MAKAPVLPEGQANFDAWLGGPAWSVPAFEAAIKKALKARGLDAHFKPRTPAAYGSQGSLRPALEVYCSRIFG